MAAIVALALLSPALAQEQPVKKKPAAAKKKTATKARPQATPEQIRRFNELQKKQKQ